MQDVLKGIIINPICRVITHERSYYLMTNIKQERYSYTQRRENYIRKLYSHSLAPDNEVKHTADCVLTCSLIVWDVSHWTCLLPCIVGWYYDNNISGDAQQSETWQQVLANTEEMLRGQTGAAPHTTWWWFKGSDQIFPVTHLEGCCRWPCPRYVCQLSSNTGPDWGWYCNDNKTSLTLITG